MWWHISCRHFPCDSHLNPPLPVHYTPEEEGASLWSGKESQFMEKEEETTTYDPTISTGTHIVPIDILY
jgi:hypothetical protein